MLEVGQSASITRTITQDDIQAFAELTGDFNPIHIDPAFAAKTPFGRPIAHGMLGAGLISTVLATKLPGPGTIYLKQSVDFKKPVFVGDTLTVTVKVATARADKPIFTLETSVTNAAGDLLIQGEAMVKYSVAKAAAVEASPASVTRPAPQNQVYT